MRVTITAVGRLKDGPERQLSARYLERFGKSGAGLGLDFARLIELPESRASNAATRKREEAAALEKALPDGALLMLLDERGTTPDSQDFAALMAGWRDGGRRDLVIAIGGADGHDPALRKRADAVIALSALTWPHQLVRLLLAEQLYRAATILSGHPYHRS